MGRKRLSPSGVGDPEYCHVHDRIKLKKRCFNFRGIDVDSARNHHVIEAVAHIDVTIRIETTNISKGQISVDLHLLSLRMVVDICEIGPSRKIPAVYDAIFTRWFFLSGAVEDADSRI